jgi:hypothetical protein
MGAKKDTLKRKAAWRKAVIEGRVLKHLTRIQNAGDGG